MTDKTTLQVAVTGRGGGFFWIPAQGRYDKQGKQDRLTALGCWPGAFYNVGYVGYNSYFAISRSSAIEPVLGKGSEV